MAPVTTIMMKYDFQVINRFLINSFNIYSLDWHHKLDILSSRCRIVFIKIFLTLPFKVRKIFYGDDVNLVINGISEKLRNIELRKCWREGCLMSCGYLSIESEMWAVHLLWQHMSWLDIFDWHPLNTPAEQSKILSENWKYQSTAHQNRK